MKVVLNEVWSTPSTLHATVTVVGKDALWHHKHRIAMPLGDIPEEALEPLLRFFQEPARDEVILDVPLF